MIAQQIKTLDPADCQTVKSQVNIKFIVIEYDINSQVSFTFVM